MKTRTPRTFQVVYRRRKVLQRPDVRPQPLTARPTCEPGRLSLAGRG